MRKVLLFCFILLFFMNNLNAFDYKNLTVLKKISNSQNVDVYTIERTILIFYDLGESVLIEQRISLCPTYGDNLGSVHSNILIVPKSQIEKNRDLE